MTRKSKTIGAVAGLVLSIYAPRAFAKAATDYTSLHKGDTFIAAGAKVPAGYVGPAGGAYLDGLKATPMKFELPVKLCGTGRV